MNTPLKNTILWADDDADDLLLMKEILLKNGKSYDIVEAANGREAIEYLRRAKENDALPCLVILDINMPVMDGKQTLSEIKRNKEFDSLPIVVFTTSNSQLDRLFCKQMQVEMITKPPSFQSLESVVIKILNYCVK